MLCSSDPDLVLASRMVCPVGIHVVRHETTLGQKALGVSFDQTQLLWRKKTGQAMVNKGGSGNSSNNVGACGSCAYPLDHGQLSHGATEQAQIDAVTETLGVDSTSTWADENIDSLNFETVGDPVAVSSNEPQTRARAPAGRWGGGKTVLRVE